ncbi:MAG: putative membrane protein YeaQ/YmgE (transglycosylase-associated protein family) [Planctomycetota bacterium]|jgi:uncharacterized membrane protein YeaQ/YmgE (transglycosylase-associated protein family)
MDMEPEQLAAFLTIGAVAGWLAGQLSKGGGFGLVRNIILGVLGAVVGGWLFGVLEIEVGGKWLGPIVTATAGALVLVFGLGLLKKK